MRSGSYESASVSLSEATDGRRRCDVVRMSILRESASSTNCQTTYLKRSTLAKTRMRIVDELRSPPGALA